MTDQSEDQLVENGLENGELESNVIFDQESQGLSPGWKKNIVNLELTPDPIILNKIIDLLSDKNVRISKVSEAILKDPITTLEILFRANSGEFATEKSKVSAVHTAVVRIGSEELFKIMKSLLSRNNKLSPELVSEVNQLRTLSCRASIIAEILSTHLQRDITEIAQTCSLLSYFGLMLACETLKSSYLELSHIKKRNALNYKLLTTYGYDPNKVQLDYFQKKHLPNLIFFAFDKELKCKTTAQSSLRFIVESAMEISEAQEEDKIEKYKHFHKLPAKSSLRLLKINEQIYETIFNEIEEALGITKKTKKSDNHDEETIDNLNIDHDHNSERTERALPAYESTPEATSSRTPTLIMDRSELVNFFTKSGSAVFIEKAAETIDQEKTELSSSSEAIIGMLQSICENAKSAKELVHDLMEVVIEKGPFSRTAIIELTEGRKEAYIHTALGEDFDNLKQFETISVKDPLSPLSTITTKVQSFNSKLIQSDTSPFGITSYAISPIKGNSIAQLVFYADCGTEKPLPFEARKVFRLAVALLNEALPKLTQNKENVRK